MQRYTDVVVSSTSLVPTSSPTCIRIPRAIAVLGKSIPQLRIAKGHEGTSRRTAQARKIFGDDNHELEATRSDIVVLSTVMGTALLSIICRWQHWRHCALKARNTATGAKILLKSTTADRSQKKDVPCYSKKSIYPGLVPGSLFQPVID